MIETHRQAEKERIPIETQRQAMRTGKAEKRPETG